MCVLSTNQNTYQGHIEVTVKHLLLMFTFQATGGLNVLSDVLRFVSFVNISYIDNGVVIRDFQTSLYAT